MTELHIIRKHDSGTQTRGHLVVLHDGVPVFACLTLELPWRNNQRRVSCIPPLRSVYKGVKHVSPKFGKCVHIQNVSGRDGILIHPANRVDQLLGCVAVGLGSADLNADGNPDITQSKLAMELLMNALPDSFPIVITDETEGYVG